MLVAKIYLNIIFLSNSFIFNIFFIDVVIDNELRI